MITVVVTSCERPEKLKKTIDSFLKYNTHPIEKYIIIEDSGDQSMVEKISQIMPENSQIIFNVTNIGQIKSIDKAYSYVETEYIFHCENDWEFYYWGFMEKSLEILEHNKDILQVWLRDHNDTNTHPIEPQIYKSGNTKFQLMAIGALGGAWDGFSWNPGLRRLSDYKLIAPFSQYIQEGDFNALTECRIGQQYRQWNFRAAILMQGYVKHQQ